LPSGTNGKFYRELFEQSVIPALKEFGPDLLLVSAGFDAHKSDPLASLRLDNDDFQWIGEQLAAVGKEYCQGRVISFLEGGYNLDALAVSTVAYIRAFI
jgi:acetoin utilization deacetylase AcuC-like enzyme